MRFGLHVIHDWASVMALLVLRSVVREGALMKSAVKTSEIGFLAMLVGGRIKFFRERKKRKARCRENSLRL